MRTLSLREGEFYTRKQIHSLVGGDEVSYLPHVDGKVVCGCFDKELNPDAPDRIPFGNGRDVVKYAELLVRQDSIIPVFIKRAPQRWEYVGQYHAVKIATDSKSLHPSAAKRDDAVGVLHFERGAKTNQSAGEQGALPDIDLEAAEGLEGRARLVTHLKRERDPRLSKLKRQAVLKKAGRLICEACDFDFASVPELGGACCEVHHILPLASRNANEKTRLEDLVILCSNCHRMIHRSNPLMSVRQLRHRLSEFNRQ